MATTLLDTLRTEMDSISSEYDRDFAGQSRNTRDMDQLDGLIRKTKDVLKRIDEIPAVAQGPQLTTFRELVVGSQSTYETEKKAIETARSMGPEFAEFSLQATLANFVFARYGRHFAGQDRSTRDVGLLGEMIEDLKQIRKQMGVLASKKKSENYDRDINVVDSNLKMYQNELTEIQAVHKNASKEDQAGIMASLANEQFNVYRIHFAGQSRNTRRPQLLMRVVDNLKRIKTTMEALKRENVASEHNPKNVEIVTENLAMYETELGEIRKARQSTSFADLMGMLGGNANEVFDSYRQGYAGKNRGEVDLANLSTICDRLGEILRQMVDLSRAEKNDSNARNIEIVCDQLAMYEQEFEAVRNVQGPKAAS